jgi:hypothetical protein
MKEVARDEFLRDPAAVLRRAETEGPIIILDSSGNPTAMVSAPRDEALSANDGALRRRDDEMTLVEDLRRTADANPPDNPIGQKCRAAADRIEELERQVESLKEALDEQYRLEPTLQDFEY